MTRLRIKDRRTPSQAKAMLATQVRYGQGQAHAWEKYDLSNEEGVKKLLADAGYTNYRRLVEELRPKDAVLPLGTHVGWHGWEFKMPTGGGSYSAIRHADGEELARIEGESGRFVVSQYQERFDDSVRNLQRCTSGEEAHYGDLLSCFADGLASIEAFVNEIAQPHLDRLPRGQDEMVSLDYKLDEWIPLLSGGQRVDKSQLWWRHFQEVRSIRNWRQAHPRASVYGIGDSTFCNQLNLWRNGVAIMLLYLHALTGRLAPPELVKWAYVPDIERIRD